MCSISITCSENIFRAGDRNAARSRDGSEPMRFTDSNLRYDIEQYPWCDRSVASQKDILKPTECNFSLGEGSPISKSKFHCWEFFWQNWLQAKLLSPSYLFKLWCCIEPMPLNEAKTGLAFTSEGGRHRTENEKNYTSLAWRYFWDAPLVERMLATHILLPDRGNSLVVDDSTKKRTIEPPHNIYLHSEYSADCRKI
jgi:hypothetical protein